MNDEFRTARFRANLPADGVPGSFGIVTAWNPNGLDIDPAENKARNATFAAYLDQLKLVHFPITGYDPESSHKEEGFGIICDPEITYQLGQKFDQLAVYYVKEDHLTLLSCGPEREAEPLGSWLERLDD